MSIRIYDDQNMYMSTSSGDDWFYITFDSDGDANFWLHPEVSTLDVDLEVHEGSKNNRIARSSKGTGEDDLISELPVTAGTTYYVKVKHYSGSGRYLLRAKNYPTSSGGSFDLGITTVNSSSKQPFTTGEEVRFAVNVKNYSSNESPGYRVAVYDSRGRLLDYDDEKSLPSSETGNASLYVTINEPGDHELKFVIEPDSGKDADSNDNTAYRTYTWTSLGDNSTNLGIAIIVPFSPESGDFNTYEDVELQILVRNYMSTYSPEYRVAIYDSSNNMLGYADQPSLSGRGSKSSYITINMSTPGTHELKFAIETDTGIDTNPSDNIEYKSFTWINSTGGVDCDLGTQQHINRVNKHESKYGAKLTLAQIMSEFNSYDKAIIEDLKFNLYANFDRLCKKINELVKKVEMTEQIHYFRNKLNKAPKTLEALLREKSKWTLLPPHLSAFHMHGIDGVFNLKFVSKNGGLFEAVYNKNNRLVTDRLNMGTYNFVGPDDASGHTEYDVKPYNKYGNTERCTGDGAVISFGKAIENLAKCSVNLDALQRYQKYYSEMNGQTFNINDSIKILEDELLIAKK